MHIGLTAGLAVAAVLGLGSFAERPPPPPAPGPAFLATLCVGWGEELARDMSSRLLNIEAGQVYDAATLRRPGWFIVHPLADGRCEYREVGDDTSYVNMRSSDHITSQAGQITSRKLVLTDVPGIFLLYFDEEAEPVPEPYPASPWS